LAVTLVSKLFIADGGGSRKFQSECSLENQRAIVVAAYMKRGQTIFVRAGGNTKA
jgi:hypothetical protein